MNTEQIEHRLKTLALEKNALEINHEAMVKENKKTNQEFQQQVVKNQTRFAQITGAITELQQLNNGATHEPTDTGS